MEHAQRGYSTAGMTGREIAVLILILMEHAQRGCHFGYSTAGMTGLNPYFNGTCSKSKVKMLGRKLNGKS